MGRVRVLVAMIGFVVALAALGVSRPAEAKFASILIDAKTGAVLGQHNADGRNYPASLTKMMTLYLTFEALRDGRLQAGQHLPVSAHAAAQAPSKLDLAAGETITVEQAILALTVKSANDVAAVLGEALGGTEAHFGQMMTQKARELGMRSTVFRNASGLPNPGQVTTARDLATLARALVRDFPEDYHYFSAREFIFQGATIPTHNHVLVEYDGADGIKTGYIHASGFNLVSSAVRDGRRLIGVILGGTTSAARDHAMMRLLDSGFNMDSPLRKASYTVSDEAPAPPQAARRTLHRARARAKTIEPPEPATLASAVAVAEGAGDDAPETSWGIQVGAYARLAQAKAAAQKAVHSTPILAKATISIGRAKVASGAVYRARLMSLSEHRARAACVQLHRHKAACLVVGPGGMRTVAQVSQ